MVSKTELRTVHTIWVFLLSTSHSRPGYIEMALLVSPAPDSLSAVLMTSVSFSSSTKAFVGVQFVQLFQFENCILSSWPK